MDDLITIRGMLSGDLNLILNSWLESYWDQGRNPHLRGLTKTDFMNGHKAQVLDAISRSLIFCAVDKTNPDNIFGWLCVEPETPSDSHALHYVYVKHTYRKMGICQMLLKYAIGGDQFIYTHHAKHQFARFLSERAKYNHYRFQRRAG